MGGRAIKTRQPMAARPSPPCPASPLPSAPARGAVLGGAAPPRFTSLRSLHPALTSRRRYPSCHQWGAPTRRANQRWRLSGVRSGGSAASRGRARRGHGARGRHAPPPLPARPPLVPRARRAAPPLTPRRPSMRRGRRSRRPRSSATLPSAY